MKLHVQLVTVAVCEPPDEQRQGGEGVAFELDVEIDDQDQPAQGAFVPLIMPRDEPQHDDQEQSEPGQTVFGDDAGIDAHSPYRVRGHGPVPTACEPPLPTPMNFNTCRARSAPAFVAASILPAPNPVGSIHGFSTNPHNAPNDW